MEPEVPLSRWTSSYSPHVRRSVTTAFGSLLFLTWSAWPGFSPIFCSSPTAAPLESRGSGEPVIVSTPTLTTAATCDPPGPPPRFGCQWSTTVCDWFCAVCDPFSAPPRPSSCTWDGNVCNWLCPGYTGV